MKKLYFLLLIIGSTQIVAQTVRNYSNEFLNIGVDARALGMSKSVTATTNDVNATYWNPAGLVAIEDYQGSLMHASYFAGIANYNFAAAAMPIDKYSAIGVSIVRFGVDDILNTTELIDNQGNINFNRIRLFSTADYAFNLSYAKKLMHKNIQFGVNAKVIRRIIGDFASAWGFGFDAGIQYTKNNWSYGLVIRDITTTYNTWSVNQEEFDKIKNSIPGQNQELPETTEITKPKVQLGIARKFSFGRDFHLLSEIDLHMRFAKTNDVFATNFVSIEPTIGFELDYTNLVFLRVGAGNIQKTTQFDGSKSIAVQPNFGVGFTYNGISVDYALTNIGNTGNGKYSNIFSIKIDYQFFRN
ncbi:MAG: PorV/PorQ family protein [Flavobacteriaceae bacterium]|nr:PorV/PorQ family protein [Flavobacteriaceae bacterium]